MHASRYVAARLVHNHSSIAPGLKRVLDRLAERLPDSDTVTPGRLSQTRGRREQFTLSFGATSGVGGSVAGRAVATPFLPVHPSCTGVRVRVRVHTRRSLLPGPTTRSMTARPYVVFRCIHTQHS